MPDNVQNRRPVYSYAHRGDGDIIDMAASQNLPRVRRQEVGLPHRRPVPVVARDQQVFEQLHQRRDALSSQLRSNMRPVDNNIAKLRGVLTKVREARPEEPADSETARVLERQQAKIEQAIFQEESTRNQWRQQSEAVESTPILGPEYLPRLHPDAKLLVLGHGEAGAPYLSSTERATEAFSLRQVAQDLRDRGLPPNFSQFALTSCHSADAESRTKFVEDPSTESTGGIAPAQSLADELAAAGFMEPKVKGYQGKGLRVPNGLHAERVSEDGSEISRRKDVRKEFKPTSKPWWMR